MLSLLQHDALFLWSCFDSAVSAKQSLLYRAIEAILPLNAFLVLGLVICTPACSALHPGLMCLRILSRRASQMSSWGCQQP